MENSIKTYYPILKVWSYHAIVVISHPDDVEVKDIFKENLCYYIKHLLNIILIFNIVCNVHFFEVRKIITETKLFLKTITISLCNLFYFSNIFFSSF